ncbi:McrC family protein [Rhodococcoides fascians]|uniref:McrC family protein n=1 Tax=Rhodococcoides fascians TaxID=1828 RepID=UPI00379278EB
MIELDEHSDELIDGISAPSVAQQQRIQNALGKRIELTWLSGDRLKIRSGSYVGVVVLPGGVTIRVRPKIAGGSLGVLTMFALSSGARLDELRELTRAVTFDKSLDTVELMCRLLCAEARRVITHGPIRDYRTTQDDLGFVRGRLDLRRQSLIHFGQLDRIACTFDEYDHDIAENRLILDGLTRARRLSRNDSTLATLARLMTDFDELMGQHLSQRAPDVDIHYDRRNSHYRPAHIWAKALLDNLSLLDAPPADGASTATFMIDMNKLFERFVEWFVDQSIAGTAVTVTKQKSDFAKIRVDQAQPRAMIPDLVLWRGERHLAVDVKYKIIAVNKVSIDDLYQLLIYAQSYLGFNDIPTAMIVLPTVEQTPQSSLVELTLRATDGSNTSTRVEVFGLPLPALVSELTQSSNLLLLEYSKKFKQMAQLDTEDDRLVGPAQTAFKSTA